MMASDKISARDIDIPYMAGGEGGRESPLKLQTDVICNFHIPPPP